MKRLVKIISKYNYLAYRKDQDYLDNNGAIVESLKIDDDKDGTLYVTKKHGKEFTIDNVNIITMDKHTIQARDVIYDFENKPFKVYGIQWLDDLSGKKYCFVLLKDNVGHYVYIRASEIVKNFVSHRMSAFDIIKYKLYRGYESKVSRIMAIATILITLAVATVYYDDTNSVIAGLIVIAYLSNFIIRGNEILSHSRYLTECEKAKNESKFDISDDDIKKSLNAMTQLVKYCKEERDKRSKEAFDIEELAEYLDDYDE